MVHVAGTRNAHAVRRYLEEGWGRGDMAVVNPTCTPSVKVYLAGSSGPTRGTRKVKELIGFFRSIFPDVSLRVEQTVAEGDTVAARWTCSGTQKGAWTPGIPPSGKVVTWTGIYLYRLVNGRIAEERIEEDLLGLKTRLDLVSAKAA
jgi:predicted ester cyclase